MYILDSPYDVPYEWVKRYEIKNFSENLYGTNLMIIRKDRSHLFPEVMCTKEGIFLSKSKFTGAPLISGTAMARDLPLIGQNVSLVSHPCVINKKNICSKIDPVLMVDRIIELTIKRCLKCKNCTA